MMERLFLFAILALFHHPKGVFSDKSISLLPESQFNFDTISNFTAQPHTLLTADPVYFTHVFAHLTCSITANITRIDYITSQIDEPIELLRYRKRSNQNEVLSLQVVKKIILEQRNADASGFASYTPSQSEVCEEGDMFGVWVAANVYPVALIKLPSADTGATYLIYTQSWASMIKPDVGDTFSNSLPNILNPSNVIFLPALRIHLDAPSPSTSTTFSASSITPSTNPSTGTTSLLTTTTRTTIPPTPIPDSTTRSVTTKRETTTTTETITTPATGNANTTEINSETSTKARTEQPPVDPIAPGTDSAFVTSPPFISTTNPSNSSVNPVPAQSDSPDNGMWSWLLPVIIAAAVTLIVIIILVIVIVSCHRNQKMVQHSSSHKGQYSPPISNPNAAYADLEYTSDYMTIKSSNSTSNGTRTAVNPEKQKQNGNNNLAFEPELYATVKKPAKLSTNEDPTPILDDSQPATFGTFRGNNKKSTNPSDIVMTENDLYEATDFSSRPARETSTSIASPLFDEELYTKC